MTRADDPANVAQDQVIGEALQKASELGGCVQWRGHEVVSAPCANDRIEHSLRLDYGKPDLEKF